MSNFKRWTAVGLGAALIAGCSDQGERPAETPATAPAAAAGEGGEGGGEGGESGEGGVNVAAAATDPVVYLSALALVEAHVRAAAEAAGAGQQQAAAEMFAHPVSEVLVDMQPTFQQLGVANFEEPFIAASTATAQGAAPAEVRRQAEGLLDTLEAAEARAPAGGLRNPDVAAAVIADMVDRGALQYGAAKASDAYEPYLDGYGFLLTARAWRERHGAEIARAAPETARKIDAAIAALETAYPTATRPATLGANEGALLAAASQVKLATSR
jgi:hypothetical protein